jgi:hypothetical protein
MRRPSLRAVALIAFSALLVTCRDGTSPPVPGKLTVKLVSTNVDAGLLVTITGARVDSARSSHTYFVTRSVSDTEFRLVVGGNVGTGVIAEIWVPDTRAAASYVGTVTEAALPGTFAQRPVVNYVVQVVNEP